MASEEMTRALTEQSEQALRLLNQRIARGEDAIYQTRERESRAFVNVQMATLKGQKDSEAHKVWVDVLSPRPFSYTTTAAREAVEALA